MAAGASYYQWAVTLTRGQLLDHVLEIEARLRSFVRVTLRAEKGAAWESAIPGSIADAIRAKGPASGDLLDRADLGQLEGIVLSRWGWFQPMLGEKPEFKTWMDEFRQWRNHLAHGLTPSEDEKIEIAVAIRRVGQKIPPEELQHPSVASKGVVGRRVVWSDDRPESTLVLRRILVMLGIEVFPVLDNDEAEELVRQLDIDLVVSDIDKGDAESGLLLPERLRSHDHPAPVYFYVGTVHDDRPLPDGSAGITNDPTALIRDVLGLLSQSDD